MGRHLPTSTPAATRWGLTFGGMEAGPIATRQAYRWQTLDQAELPGYLRDLVLAGALIQEVEYDGCGGWVVNYQAFAPIDQSGEVKL